MLLNTDTKEQRRSTRFQVGDNVYAILKQPQYSELGKVIDISATGISFLCLNEGDWSEESFTIDIISSEDRQESGQLMTIKGLPLKPIAYCRDEEKKAAEINQSQNLRRCGVAFDLLNNRQKSMLDMFIARQAVNRA